MQDDDVGLCRLPRQRRARYRRPIDRREGDFGRRGHVIAVRYKVTDAVSSQAEAARLIVKNSRGVTVKSFACGTKATATWRSIKWTSKARGTFRYYVYAKDLGGNAQAKVGSAKVLVR